MPLSDYDRFAGGKRGNAAKTRAAMIDHYGPEKGEQVFRAWLNKRRGQGKGRGIAPLMLAAARKEREQRG